MIKGVSFDAAGTLLMNRYHPGAFLRSCAEANGLAVSDADVSLYLHLMQDRLPEFWIANQTRLRSTVQAHWLSLTSDWLQMIGEESSLAAAICEEGERQMNSTDLWFELFADAVPALDHLVTCRIPAYVLSNWDNSLYAILAGKGLDKAFDLIVASLEEGVEKPSPEIFMLTSRRVGLPSEHLLHIGDSWNDDVVGALDAGWHSGFIDRTISAPAQVERRGTQIIVRGSSLVAIVEAALSA